jgi:hypothetical protein
MAQPPPGRHFVYLAGSPRVPGTVVLAWPYTQPSLSSPLRNCGSQVGHLPRTAGPEGTSSRGLHPTILSSGGLAAALQNLARRSAVPVQLEVQTKARLPERVEVAVYYVVSEALTNAAKHASASAIHVIVDETSGIVRLSVSDDGIGGADPTHGSGLVGLKDRVEVTGGTLLVQSHLDEGTRLVVEFPVSSALLPSATESTSAGNAPLGSRLTQVPARSELTVTR